MQITEVQNIKGATNKGASDGIKSATQKEAIVARLFTSGVLVAIGRFLATDYNGQSYAEIMAKDSLDLPATMPINGHKVAIAEGSRKLRIKQGAAWLCPCCDSAHGTRLNSSASKDEPISVTQLESNEFFVQPATGKLFAVSGTCLKKYVLPKYGSKIVDSDDFSPAVPKKA